MEFSKDDKIQISKALLRLSSFTKKEFTEQDIVSWVDGMENSPVPFPAVQWIEAIKNIAYRREDFPTMGKLFETVKAANGVDDMTLAERAWQEVQAHISRTSDGYNGDPVIKSALLYVGGLLSIRQSDGVNLDFKKKYFM